MKKFLSISLLFLAILMVGAFLFNLLPLNSANRVSAVNVTPISCSGSPEGGFCAFREWVPLFSGILTGKCINTANMLGGSCCYDTIYTNYNTETRNATGAYSAEATMCGENGYKACCHGINGLELGTGPCYSKFENGHLVGRCCPSPDQKVSGLAGYQTCCNANETPYSAGSTGKCCASGWSVWGDDGKQVCCQYGGYKDTTGQGVCCEQGQSPVIAGAYTVCCPTGQKAYIYNEGKNIGCCPAGNDVVGDPNYGQQACCGAGKGLTIKNAFGNTSGVCCGYQKFANNNPSGCGECCFPGEVPITYPSNRYPQCPVSGGCCPSDKPQACLLEGYVKTYKCCENNTCYNSGTTAANCCSNGTICGSNPGTQQCCGSEERCLPNGTCCPMSRVYNNSGVNSCCNGQVCGSNLCCVAGQRCLDNGGTRSCVSDADCTATLGNLQIVYSWGSPHDLDTGTTVFSKSYGWSCGGSDEFVSWSGDNTSSGGSETITINLESSKAAGKWTNNFNVDLRAGWYIPAGGAGPATVTITYKGGTITYQINPGRQENCATQNVGTVSVTYNGGNVQISSNSQTISGIVAPTGCCTPTNLTGCPNGGRPGRKCVGEKSYQDFGYTCDNGRCKEDLVDGNCPGTEDGEKIYCVDKSPAGKQITFDKTIYTCKPGDRPGFNDKCVAKVEEASKGLCVGWTNRACTQDGSGYTDFKSSCFAGRDSCVNTKSTTKCGCGVGGVQCAAGQNDCGPACANLCANDAPCKQQCEDICRGQMQAQGPEKALTFNLCSQCVPGGARGAQCGPNNIPKITNALSCGLRQVVCIAGRAFDYLITIGGCGMLGPGMPRCPFFDIQNGWFCGNHCNPGDTDTATCPPGGMRRCTNIGTWTGCGNGGACVPEGATNTCSDGSTQTCQDGAWGPCVQTCPAGQTKPHYTCQNNVCTLVNSCGTTNCANCGCVPGQTLACPCGGQQVCQPDGTWSECPDKHTRCNPQTKKCECVNGQGDNECDTVGADCCPQGQTNPHSECKNGKCTLLNTCGVTDCAACPCSDPKPTCPCGGEPQCVDGMWVCPDKHTECNPQTDKCECVDGVGGNECTTVGGSCKCIPGQLLECPCGGVQVCQADGAWSKCPDKHTECAGADPNSCTTGAGICQCVDGQGDNQCSTVGGQCGSGSQDEPTCPCGGEPQCVNGKWICPNKHTECNSTTNICECVDGSGPSECSTLGAECSCSEGEEENCVCGGQRTCQPDGTWSDCGPNHSECVSDGSGGNVCQCEPGSGDDACQNPGEECPCKNGDTQACLCGGNRTCQNGVWSDCPNAAGCVNGTCQCTGQAGQDTCQILGATCPCTDGEIRSCPCGQRICIYGAWTKCPDESSCPDSDDPEATKLKVTPDYCAYTRTGIPFSGLASFSWQFTDSDIPPNPQTMWQMQISTDKSNFASNLIYDSGLVHGTANIVNLPVLLTETKTTDNCKNNLPNRCDFLNYGENYYWRVKVVENTGLTSGWVYYNGDKCGTFIGDDQFGTEGCDGLYDGATGTISSSAATIYQYPYIHPGPFVSYTFPQNSPPGAVQFTDNSKCYNTDNNQYEFCTSMLAYGDGSCFNDKCYNWWFTNFSPSNLSSPQDTTIGGVGHDYANPGTYKTGLQVCDELGCCYWPQNLKISTSNAKSIPSWSEKSPL